MDDSGKTRQGVNRFSGGEFKLCLVGGNDVHTRIPLAQRLSDEGWDVTIVGSCDPQPFEKAGVQFAHYYYERSANPVTFFRSFLSLYRGLKQINPDAVHGFDTLNGILAILAGAMLGAAHRSRTITGMGYYHSSTSPGISRRIYMLVQLPVCRLSSHTVFQSRADRHKFLSSGLCSLSDSTQIEGSGIDLSSFPILGPCSQPGTMTFLYAGRMIIRKGARLFIEASSILKDEPGAAGVRCLMAGCVEDSDPDSLSLDELNRAEVAGNITYLGEVRDISNTMEQVDVVVLPSIYGEGLPRILLEAAVSGRFSLVADSEFARELIDRGLEAEVHPEWTAQSLYHAMKRCVAAGRGTLGARAARAAGQARKNYGLDSVAAKYGRILLLNVK